VLAAQDFNQLCQPPHRNHTDNPVHRWAVIPSNPSQLERKPRTNSLNNVSSVKPVTWFHRCTVSPVIFLPHFEAHKSKALALQG